MQSDLRVIQDNEVQCVIRAEQEYTEMQRKLYKVEEQLQTAVEQSKEQIEEKQKQIEAYN